ncbi:hypothetical protein PYCCODRAFT_212820 [Trametes coccinea BRFM310]|uniref:Uncharacterized protein n=1 Tax=Trametes coccinea (strain BRFM310) TaxID=1353009 RepID=A0A1Y2IT84_TRAC3|nr:hypothetical protein PYCCODRAFT_212820 [Trametes coccinea BRFM310]
MVMLVIISFPVAAFIPSEEPVRCPRGAPTSHRLSLPSKSEIFLMFPALLSQPLCSVTLAINSCAVDPYHPEAQGASLWADFSSKLPEACFCVSYRDVKATSHHLGG